MRCVLSLLALLLLGAQEPGARARWWVIVAEGGAIVGTIAETRSVDGRESVVNQRVTVHERGDSATAIVERTTTRYDATGRVEHIAKDRQSGRISTGIEARILADRAEIVRRTSTGPPRTTTVMLPPGTRFDSGQGLIAGWDRAAVPELEILNFNLEAMAVDRVVIAATAPPAGAAGRSALLRRTYEGENLRGAQLLILDADGRIIETHQPLFGTSMVIRPATAAEAAREPQPLRPVTDALTQSPFRIPANALNGRIRYLFGYRHGIAFPLPATGEQRAATEAGRVTLDVCGDCGPGLPSTPEAIADALRPTTWLQSDHPRIRDLAAPVRSRGISDASRMTALVRIVEREIADIDFAGHFSAVEALARRRGDCTESAVLLAALGRAAGIPTKVVSGLVYSRSAYHGTANVFLPHSWVLAYVGGRWRSFDAALGSFDSTHIAFTVGDGDARSIAAANQLAGLITFEGMQEVRRRPAG